MNYPDRQGYWWMRDTEGKTIRVLAMQQENEIVLFAYSVKGFITKDILDEEYQFIWDGPVFTVTLDWPNSDGIWRFLDPHKRILKQMLIFKDGVCHLYGHYVDKDGDICFVGLLTREAFTDLFGDCLFYQ